MPLARLLFYLIVVIAGIPTLAIHTPVEPKPAIQIRLNGQEAPRASYFVQSQDTLFVSLRDIIPLLGGKLRYQRIDNSYSVELRNTSFKLFPYTKEYSIDTTSHVWSIAPILFEQSLYVPAEDFFKAMGYQMTQKNTCIMLTSGLRKKGPLSSKRAVFNIPTTNIMPTITSINVSLVGHRYQLHLMSTYPLSRTIGMPSKNHTVVWDLPNTTTSLKPVVFAKGIFSTIRFVQLSKHLLRLQVTLRSTQSMSVLMPTSTGATIENYTDIVSLQQKKTASSYQITLTGLAPFLYTTAIMTSPMRLVIDIPNATNRLPHFLESIHPISSGIRTSQFEITPAKVRVVVDLTGTHNITLTSLSKGLLIDISLQASKKLANPKSTPTPLVLPKPLPLHGLVVVIDPGHGGDDPGALGERDEYEKEFTIDISKRLEKLLLAQGAEVLMCRTKDQNPTLEERTLMGNLNHADLFISVHINSFFRAFSHGTETYYYKPADQPLAEIIHAHLLKDLGLQDKGLKRARLYVLRNTTMPSVLIEPLFITNSDELALLKTPEFRQKIAQSVANGVLRYRCTHFLKPHR